MRTFGHAVAVQTAGPDAVEPEVLEERKEQARTLLARAIHEQMRRAQVLGYEVLPETVEVHHEEEDDRVIFTTTWQGRQTRGLLERLRWAWGLS